MVSELVTPGDPVDCSPPGSSVHGILQARTLEWVALPRPQGIFPTQEWNPRLLHLLVVASLTVEAHGLCSSTACGIFVELGDQTRAPSIGTRSLNQWTSK